MKQVTDMGTDSSATGPGTAKNRPAPDTRVGALAGGIAHDLNSVLTLIYGYGGMALETLGDTEKTEENIRRIISAADRARQLTAQLLELGKEAAVKRVPVKVTEVLADTIDHIRPSIPEGVTIRRNIRAPRAAVMVPPAQLFRVMLNIMLNAIQAMREKGGTLTVTVTQDNSPATGEEPESLVRISFRDTGKGMDEKTVRQIFKPFYTTGDGNRSGIGLTVVNDLVREMGGNVSVSSVPGEGTTFEISLPGVTETETAS